MAIKCIRKKLDGTDEFLLHTPQGTSVAVHTLIGVREGVTTPERGPLGRPLVDHCGVLGRRAQGSREDNKSLYSRCRFWLTTNTKKHPWVRAMVFAEKSDLATHQVGKLADAPVIHQRASQATHPADRSLVFRPVRPRVLEIFGAQQPHFARACEGSSLRKRTVWPRSMCWNRKWFVASALLVGLQLLSRDMWSDLYGTPHQTKLLPPSALHDRARSLISHMYIDVHTSLVFHSCKSVCPIVASLLSQSSTIF